MKLDRLGHVAQIGGDADLDALRLEAEAHRIDGVVRNAEALDLDIADAKRRARLEGLERRSASPQSIAGAVSRVM